MEAICMFAATIVLHRYVPRRKLTFTWLAPQSIKHTFTTPAPLMYSTLTTASLNSQLNKCGYCVVRGALSTAQTDQTLALIWDYIEAASAAQQKLTATTSETVANRHEPWSWTAAWPAHVEGGILPYFGAGQSTASWFIRSLPSVQHVFSLLHSNPPNLCTSLDGLLIWRSNKIHERGWFHIDQNPSSKPHQCSIQGLVNLLPSSPSTGGNVLIRGSHKIFPQHYTNDGEYRERLAELNGDDWLEIRGDDPILKAYSDNHDIVMNSLLPGDILLWDSRVMHCSSPGTASSQDTERPHITRAAVLVTMVDASTVQDDVRERRREAVKEGKTGTHWCTKQAVLGAENGEEVSMEGQRVALMGAAICKFEGLTADCQALV